MKWKSLKRGLAILLSMLLITSSGVSVYADENPTASVEQAEDSSETDNEADKNQQTEPSTQAGETDLPEAPASGEEQGTTEVTKPETESAELSTSNEEQEPIEPSAPGEEQGSTEVTEPETESTQTPVSSEEPETTEVTEPETESTQAPVPSEEQEPAESTEPETESKTEELTEIETETETEAEIEIETETETETEEEIIAFADIRDVVTFNTGNIAISVIPNKDYSDELFEACLEDNIYVVPFNENGGYTIEAEADAFFPYEVQFQYDGRTENRWFLSPGDRTTVNGHTFDIHSEFSGEVITQMNLSVAGRTVTVYPEEKEFANDGGISTYSLMPLEEKRLTADLKGFNPLQLTRVAVSSVFAGENQISAEKIAWSMSDEDNYKIISTGDVIDLSYYTKYGGTTWEMIAGDADQLNLSNIRY